MIQKETVSVHFLGIQRLATGTDNITIELSADMQVRDIIESIRNQYPELHLNEDNVIATVNHERAYPDRVLKSGDIITFLPHISGG